MSAVGWSDWRAARSSGKAVARLGEVRVGRVRHVPNGRQLAGEAWLGRGRGGRRRRGLGERWRGGRPAGRVHGVEEDFFGGSFVSAEEVGVGECGEQARWLAGAHAQGQDAALLAGGVLDEIRGPFRLGVGGGEVGRREHRDDALAFLRGAVHGEDEVTAHAEVPRLDDAREARRLQVPRDPFGPRLVGAGVGDEEALLRHEVPPWVQSNYAGFHWQLPRCPEGSCVRAVCFQRRSATLAEGTRSIRGQAFSRRMTPPSTINLLRILFVVSTSCVAGIDRGRSARGASSRASRWGRCFRWGWCWWTA